MTPGESVGLHLQVASAESGLPGEPEILRWAKFALQAAGSASRQTLTVRLVGGDEGATLNETYRRKPGPTNVLACPGPDGMPDESGETKELGDLVICVPVVRQEAAEQGKSFEAHMAHMIVHGALHLAGYDHNDAESARRMEELETRVMDGLGYPDPYEKDS